MTSRELMQHLPDRAAFRAEAMSKIDCFRSERLFVGLNCFEPGQTQATHTHAGADKFYLVLSGKATFIVGDEQVAAVPGDLVIAPAGVPHGVQRAHERTTVVVAMSPPPSASPAAGTTRS